MTSLPRVHAVTDAAVLGRPDLVTRCGRLLGTGHPVALHLRDRSRSLAAIAALTVRLGALAPQGARLFTH